MSEKKPYKTSLVRCFRLLDHTYAEVTDFCKWNALEPPSQHNWDREWGRCRDAAKILRNGGTLADALIAASDNDRLLTGDRAESVVSAARCLAFDEPVCEQHDVKRWAGEMAQWKAAVPLKQQPAEQHTVRQFAQPLRD